MMGSGAVPPAGSRGRAPGEGICEKVKRALPGDLAKPPETGSFLLRK